jgi:hypothetical protein
MRNAGMVRSPTVAVQVRDSIVMAPREGSRRYALLYIIVKALRLSTCLPSAK